MSVYYFINTAISNDLLNDILRTGLVVVASKGHGKTNAVKVLTRELLVRGLANVKVFDTALNWIFDFEHLNYQLIQQNSTVQNIDNCIFDFTLIDDPEQINRAIRKIVSIDYHNKAKMKLLCDGAIYNWVVYIVEEAQNIIGSSALRNRENRFWLKAISTGRNIGLSFIFVGQRLSDISTKAVERCNGYLIGRMNGDNDLRKIRALGGKELSQQVKTLKTGNFIYYNGKQELIEFPLFESFGKPKPLFSKPKNEIGLLEKIRSVFK